MKYSFSSIIFAALIINTSVLSAGPQNGYVDAHLTATELKQLLKTTGCDKELNAFFKNMMTGERGKKPSEQCSQLMEGRVKK